MEYIFRNTEIYRDNNRKIYKEDFLVGIKFKDFS